MTIETGAGPSGPLSAVDLDRIDAYWRAANYLSVGQIYLLDNPLLREPLRPEHVKPRLLGHWGTTPGLNFIYAHLNRVIRSGTSTRSTSPGPGTAARRSSRTPTSRAPTARSTRASRATTDGMRKLFRQFSFPGGIPSHVAPETPGSIHEGGELGYALSHAYGAAFDNPDLLVCCVVGDGEAETGPLATSWHSNKFLDPARDGAVLPILHLNGYKIANPTVLARIPQDELRSPAGGLRLRAVLRRGRRPGRACTSRWRRRMDTVVERIRAIQKAAREGGATERPRWPMIVLRTPKGWTGPKEVDGKPVEGTWRSHQVPLGEVRDERREPADARGLAAQLPAGGAVRRERGARSRSSPTLAPKGDRRMSANPHANGGLLLRDLAPAGLPRLRRRRPAPGRHDRRGDPGAGRVPARRHGPQPGRTSASSGPTRPPRTAWAPSSR